MPSDYEFMGMSEAMKSKWCLYFFENNIDHWLAYANNPFCIVSMHADRVSKLTFDTESAFPHSTLSGMSSSLYSKVTLFQGD